MGNGKRGVQSNPRAPGLSRVLLVLTVCFLAFAASGADAQSPGVTTVTPQQAADSIRQVYPAAVTPNTAAPGETRTPSIIAVATA